jgi:hypothetical protein
MTLRTHLVIAALSVTLTAGPASAAPVSGGSTVTAKLAVSDNASVGRAASVVCEAADAEGVKDVTIDAKGPDGVSVVVPIVERVELARGVVQVAGSWVPAKEGANLLRCTVLGMSSSTATASSSASVTVFSPLVPVVAAMRVSRSVAFIGKSVEIQAVAGDPEGGPLRYSWSATGGQIQGQGDAAVWTAPLVEGTYTVKVTVTDDTDRFTVGTVAVQATSVAFQDSVAAAMRGPRRVAAVEDGTFFVADADRRLHKLTKRGEFMATALEDVLSVAVGGGVVFAGTSKGELVKLDPATGRVVGRIDLGVSRGPVGLSFDSVRNVLWLAFASGVVEARDLAGAVQSRISKTSAGALVRVADVAVDAKAGIVWVAQDRSDSAGMIFGFRIADGVQVKAFGVGGTGPVRMAGGLTLGANGNLYVSDSFAGSVKVLDSAGSTVRTIGSGADGVGQLARPAGMAFMASGDLLIANLDANRLDRFGGEGGLPVCAGDTDCDGVSDVDEIAAGMDPNRADDALADPDRDGLTNAEEVAAGTNINAADSDGDGYSDSDELAAGFNPLNGADHVAQLTASASSGGPGLVRLTGVIAGLGGEVTCQQTWRQTEGPAVSLQDASGLSPSFVARKAGTYRFGFDAVCGGVAAVGTSVAVDIANVAPVADAGRIVVAPVDARLQLSAAATSDANGDSMVFGWEQVAGNAVSGPVAGRTLTARFGAPGFYAFSMTASDSAGASSAAEAQVLVVGASPVPAVSIASPVLASVGQVVTLDASASYAAPDAVFNWQQVGGAPAALTGQGTARASFQSMAAGRYAFKVSILQGTVASPDALVEVFVAAAGAERPVAVASAPAVGAVNAALTLDGSASTGSAFGWRQVAGPAAGLRNADQPKAEAYFFAAGSYVFELGVADGATQAVPARVAIEVRNAGKPIPVAVASASAAAVIGERVVLDGTASVGASSFRWTQVAGPWVVLTGGSSAAFVAPAAGRYAFELEVDDGQVRSAPVRVDVVVTQNGMEN